MKATEHLLNDHKLLRKTLESFSLDNDRYHSVFKTLARAVKGHAWFEDEIFLPVFTTKGQLHKLFTDEISQEHKDMDQLLYFMKDMGQASKKELDPYVRQLRAILESHLRKEEDALFPLAERMLDEEGMNKLGGEMENRKTEIRDLVKDFI